MSVEEFSRYWHDVHGPIGRRIPGLRRLVQCHPVRESIKEQREFDGVAELWFDDLNALEHARRSKEWLASTADEANFIDLGHTAIVVTIEREIRMTDSR